MTVLPCPRRSGGAAALGAGLEFVGRHLFGLGCASLLRLYDVRRATQAAIVVGASPITSGGFVYTNTFWQPIALSWKLGGGWFMSTAFAFTSPNGTRQAGTPNPDYWTFEPSSRFSYLGNNWVASANFFYDINTKSKVFAASQPRDGTITSGNALYGDLTAVYKVGKWSIGPVGYFEVQTTADTGAGCTPAPGVNLCGRYQTAAAGALVGYDFGPVDLQVWVTDSFVGRDTLRWAPAASTCGRASASRSGDLSNRWRRWLPRSKLATALLSRPCGKPRGLFLLARSAGLSLNRQACVVGLQ